MTAKIYRPARNAMQSGKGKKDVWVLDYEPETPRTPERVPVPAGSGAD